MDISDYLKSNLVERSLFLETQYSLIPDKFKLKENISESRLFPLFYYENTQLEFVLVIGGEFDFGLTDDELSAIYKISPNPSLTISEMKPVVKKRIDNFLVMNRPFLKSDYEDVYAGPEGMQPLFRNFDDVKKICAKYSLRMPYEAEWEYFVRAGKNEIFTFGNSLPQEKDLEKWLSWDFSNLNAIQFNNFGISGLFFGEWCQDFFSQNHSEDSYIDYDSHVIKGGGSYFWPWQDEEWVWCLSSMRMPSSDLADNQAAFRLVISI